MTTEQPVQEEPEAPPDLEALLAEAKSQKLESQLKTWDADLAKLKTRAEQTGGEARAEYERQAQILHSKLGKARVKLRELQQAGADATYELLKDVDATLADLELAFESATEKFR